MKCPLKLKTLFITYSRQTQPAPLHAIQTLSERAAAGEAQAARQCANMILNYLSGRDWALPTNE